MAKEVLEMEVKSNIGEVADGVDKAAKSTENLAKQTDKVDDATKKGATGFKGMGTAIKGVGTALKAAGIGLAVALMAKLMEVFSKNQKVVDAFDVAMESLSIAFNDLFSFISNNVGKVTGFFKSIFDDPKQSIIDFGNAVKENLIERFNSVLDTFGHLGKALKHLVKGEFGEAFNSVKDAGKESIDIWTGVDNSVDKLTETVTNAAGKIKDYATQTINSAKATVELNKASELAKVQVQGLIEEYDRQAEKLRQVRDDETKTFDERIEANKKLGDVLKEQGVEMQKLVDIQVHAAQVEFNKNKSQENLIALTEALNEKKAVEAQITGFQSEQLTNQVSLEKELGEVKKEVTNASLEGMELELAELENSYKMQIQMADKAGMATTEITKKYAKDKQVIIDAADKEKKEKAIEAEKAEAEAKKAIRDANISNIESGIGLIKSLAGDNKEVQAAALIAENAVGVAKTIINTQAANAAALATPQAVASSGAAAVPVITANNIAAGISIAASVAATAKGLSALGKGGSAGGGGELPNGAGGSQTPAPQMMQGAFELGGGVAPEPLKAFVVTDEMTNSQDQLANIRRRATI
jgi:hypothetical protein|tara:strand:+ start:784 stop:2535 length:1752 start_codon:yes stop_codon:yes gene_type:complete